MINAPHNRALRYKKETQIKLKRETEKPTIMVEEFNVLFSVIGRTSTKLARI